MAQSHLVPVMHAETPEEARQAMLRAAAIRRRLLSAGAAAQAAIVIEQSSKQAAAIENFRRITEKYEAEKARTQAQRWEDAVDDALRHAQAAHPLQSAPQDDPEDALIAPLRVASKQQIIRHLRKMASRYGVTVEMVFGQNRSKCLVTIRHWMIRFVRRCRPDWSLTAMGRMFRRDHTSILHALRQRGRPRPLTPKEIREVQGRS